jgi:two-component system LytT family response regulator
MQTAIIIDDEFDARRILKKYLERYFPNIRLIADVDSVEKGVKAINQFKPEFLFLNIKLGDGTGFDLIDQLEDYVPKIIFTTAFDEFAVKAFRYHAIDYLLKPIDPDIFVDSLNKMIEQKVTLKKEAWEIVLNQVQSSERKIGVPTVDGVKFILIENILYLEADGSYCTLNFKDSKAMIISKPLRFFEDKLENEKSFIRPHKSFLINLKYVEEYQKSDGGFLKLNSGIVVPISRNKKVELLHKLDDYFV